MQKRSPHLFANVTTRVLHTTGFNTYSLILPAKEVIFDWISHLEQLEHRKHVSSGAGLHHPGHTTVFSSRTNTFSDQVKLLVPSNHTARTQQTTKFISAQRQMQHGQNPSTALCKVDWMSNHTWGMSFQTLAHSCCLFLHPVTLHPYKYTVHTEACFSIWTSPLFAPFVYVVFVFGARRRCRGTAVSNISFHGALTVNTCC